MIILFLHATTWEGQIFEGIKKYISPDLMISKPIYGCPICMTPWWGTVVYLLFFHVSGQDWLLTVGCAAGFGVLSVVFIDIKDAAVQLTKKLEKEEKEETEDPASDNEERRNVGQYGLRAEKYDKDVRLEKNWTKGD